MENVPQLLGSQEFLQIIDCAKSMGFDTAAAKLCAADYGVAQTRWRAFIIGCRFAKPAAFFPPKKTHYNPADKQNNRILNQLDIGFIEQPVLWRTVKDAIGSLPRPEGTELNCKSEPMDLHFGRKPTLTSLKRYRAIPEEGMNRFDLQKRALHLTPRCWINKVSGGTDLFGRLWWNRPAFTIRTEFFKPEKGRYLHPEQHRPITHREAARLQSFPDSFRFIGSKTEIAKQIGNAVPPVLAARVADCVLAIFLSREKLRGRQTDTEKAQRTYESSKEPWYRSRKIRKTHIA
jgi:DNA (cytosine-5)-methyltransferase 1